MVRGIQLVVVVVVVVVVAFVSRAECEGDFDKRLIHGDETQPGLESYGGGSGGGLGGGRGEGGRSGR